jgi:hypothetical protein
MANIHTVLEAIIENATDGTGTKRVQLGVADKYEYETIRTRLVKLWSDHKEVLLAVGGEGGDPLLELSLCANFDKQSSRGTFYLGRPRRKMAKSYSFEIVDAGATPAQSHAVNDDEFPAVPTTKRAE